MRQAQGQVEEGCGRRGPAAHKYMMASRCCLAPAVITTPALAAQTCI